MTGCYRCGRTANNEVDGKGVCWEHDTSGPIQPPYRPQPGDLERALSTPQISPNLLDPGQTTLSDLVARQVLTILRAMEVEE